MGLRAFGLKEVHLMDAAAANSPPSGPPEQSAAGSFTAQGPSPPPPRISLPALPDRAPPAPLPALETAWPRPARWAMVLLLALAALLLGWHGLSSLPWGSRPTQLEHGLGYRVDINQAEKAELLQLPGIGPARVEAILNYRRSHGGFGTVEELSNVHGIGLATLERLRPWVCVGADEPDEVDNPPEGVSKRARHSAKRAVGLAQKMGARNAGRKNGKNPKGKIDVNRATARELQEIPNIGKARAASIIEERRKGPFQSVDDLKRVPGIKERLVARLGPYITVGKEQAGEGAK
jgi:competence protein ComEA